MENNHRLAVEEITYPHYVEGEVGQGEEGHHHHQHLHQLENIYIFCQAQLSWAEKNLLDIITPLIQHRDTLIKPHKIKIDFDVNIEISATLLCISSEPHSSTLACFRSLNYKTIPFVLILASASYAPPLPWSVPV